MRVAAYIDGYNLYHAIKRHGQQHHKWLDLWSLANRFVPSKSGTLTAVHYFSAYAHWKPQQMTRHRDYVAALESTGVTPHLARFSQKQRKCPSCQHRWVGHEEKETDVQIAVYLLQHAVEDKFDRALIVSRDSDLVPAARAVTELFPQKEVFAVSPPCAGHSVDMLQYCKGKHQIKVKHLEACLLPATLAHPDGRSIQRPKRYVPSA